MIERIHKTRDVYGLSRELPENYVMRKEVDNAFIDNLTRDKHIVIFGSSKQGKTCLRKKCLKLEDYILVQCSNRMDIGNINETILKQAGYEVTLSNTKTVSGKNKIIAKISAAIPGLKGSIGNETESQVAKEKSTKDLELDVDDVNDIIAALKKINFNKYIILEDFHYLKLETQRNFAVELKAFHENSKYCFIIIGVWLEENRLIAYNGDLTGRVVSVNADKWSPEQLLEVITIGEALLNISFSENFKKRLLASALESVYIVQEACYEACILKNIYETQATFTPIEDDIDVQVLIKKIVDQQSGRYHSFITHFADGFQESELQMYKWILYPVLKADIRDLERGLRYADIRKKIEEKHPIGEKLNAGNLTQALQYTAALQIKKGITPIVLDYDQTNMRLRVVDRGFLIWLKHQAIEDLLKLSQLAV